MKKTTSLIMTLLVTTVFCFGQKKALSTDDFASWKRIEHRQISNDGKYIAYELNEQKGDGVLVVHDRLTEVNDTLPYAYAAKFSPNSDFLVFRIKPAADSVRAAKKAELKKDEMPKDSLGILNLSSGEINYYTNLKSFEVPKENSSWTAILLEHMDPVKDTLALSDTLVVVDSVTVEKTKKAKEKDLKDLFLINPIIGKVEAFDHVVDYKFSKNGNTLVVATQAKDSLVISTLIVYHLHEQKFDTIFNDTGWVKKIAIGNGGQQLAFLYSKDTVDEKVYALHLANLAKNVWVKVVDSLSVGMPIGFAPSVHGKVFFSDDNSKLFFGTADIPRVPVEDSLLDEEKPKLDVWSWTDTRLQPMQLLNLDKDKKKNYLAVYRIKDKRMHQLADSTVERVSLINKNNGEVALGRSRLPYQRATSWSAEWIDDIYLIDLKTGSQKKVLEGKDNVRLSPNGEFIVWYEQADSAYHAMDTKSAKTWSLSRDVQVPFYDEWNDSPTTPSIHGVAGWTKDGKVLIYDRYDVWQFDLLAKKLPLNLTNGFGRENKTRLRYVKTDLELVYVPTSQSVIFKGFDENSYDAAYYSVQLNGNAEPHELIKGAFRLGAVQKAKDVNVALWSKQTVSQYPEVIWNSLDFASPKVISSANPQQVGFNWATTEQVSWLSFTGETLRGTLYKPEDFNPNKEYPMMVYFYERSSEGIHRHYTPYPSHSIINKTFYASNGYLVFVPDITYQISYPGKSAYNAIVSGVQFLINKHTYVDAKRIGLQGQSWGGYQIAHLVTQTDMFAAAMAGAPVSNMTSAYGGIRWGSGMSRMFQYEHTQSRIGGTLWDKPMQYIENSPVFYAPNVNTPLLMMHNDNDGAVPWYQGIEYFVALRRLDKPVWLLNYNGMKHNIETKYWANRMDLSKRMQQFFNYYLKDEASPGWMNEGLPAIKKGETFGY